MTLLKIGEAFRYARPYHSLPETIDDLPNYFHATHLPGAKKAILDRGINRIKAVKAAEGNRTPAILISSSPHKHGSDESPWQDIFEPDRGFVRYFGDNRKNGVRPEQSSGNAYLLEQFSIHNSVDPRARANAVPLLLFQRAKVGERTKGNVVFQGFGIICAAELVSQINPTTKEYFSNYVFEIAVFSMAEEGEVFDWSWINARRDPTIKLQDTAEKAPKSWQKWIQDGPIAVDKCRRQIISLKLIPEFEQRPAAGSREFQVLTTIYDFFQNRQQHRFENYASLIAASVMQRSGSSYHEEWLSRATGDGGWDFVGRLDVGLGCASTRIVVLGQAKCEALDKATNGKDIARLVARLRRGWFGVYVTTSYFSPPVQREVALDHYPVMLISGKVVADETILIAAQKGITDVVELLKEVDARYESMLRNRDPETIAFGA